MRIFLGTYSLKSYHGSEIFTYGLWNELNRRGHTVDVFAFEYGAVSRRMSSLINIEDVLPDYDLAIVSHHPVLKFLKEKPIKVGEAVCLLHSSIAELEKPIVGADRYISISAEVQKVNQKRGFVSKVVWNGVDLNRFKPLENYKRGKLVLYVGNSSTIHKHKVKEACYNLGLDYLEIGYPSCPVWHTEKFMQVADVVITIGRGAIESMACGKPVIIYGKYGADGIVTPENVERLMECNLSGRNRGLGWDVPEIEAALSEVINPSFQWKSEDYRGIAQEHFNIENKIEEILQDAILRFQVR